MKWAGVWWVQRRRATTLLLVPWCAVFLFLACGVLSCRASDQMPGQHDQPLRSLRAAQRMFVPANDTGRVTIGGRHAWSTLHDGSVVVVADWPCVSFNLTLLGREKIVGVSVVLEGGHNDFLVFFNDRSAGGNNDSSSGWKLVTDDQLREYRLPQPPRTGGPLIVSVIKITEASYFLLKALLPLTRVRFHGFAVYVTVPDDIEPRGLDSLFVIPKRVNTPRRRIEFFSDSDSNGFGIEGQDSWTCVFGLEKLENCWEGYAATASRWLDADYRIEAWSGKGVVKNALDITDRSEYPMPFYWNRTIATEQNPLWNFSQWVPDLIVVLLGTNDYYAWPYPSDSEFVNGYEHMAKTILSSYNSTSPSGVPLSLVALCGGTTENDRAPCQYVQEAVKRLRRMVDPPARIYYIEIPETLLSYPEDYGCLDHRNLVGQRKLANFLAAQIRPIMGW